MNIFDMPPDQFMGALAELRQQGVDTDALLRQYRAQSSPLAPVNRAAQSASASVADQGRREVAGGLLTKQAGTTGMDAIRSLDTNFRGGLLNMLAGGGRAVDAPMAAAQGLIPQGDMALEALGTAGLASMGGAAATRPSGSFGMGGRVDGPRRVYHGGSGDVRRAAQGRGAWFSETPDLADEYAFGGGTVQQFDINPRRPIEFANAEQRRTIGDVVSTALNGIDEIPEANLPAVSAKVNALRARYGEEARPLFEYWNNDPDIAGLFRSLGYDAISVAEKPGGAKTWAALSPDLIAANTDTSGGLLATAASDVLTPSQQMARRVLDMRAAGRASDVTDDMMAQADPQYMFNNTPLPMDEASRMARAGDMGFDAGVPLYHGTTARNDFSALTPSNRGRIGPGVYMSPDEKLASVFAGADQASIVAKEPPLPNSRVMPLVSTNNPADEAARDIASAARRQAGIGTDEGRVAFQRGLGEFDGVSMPTERTILDPRNIRSRFARFDPEFAHLSNLSAANASATSGAAATSASQDRLQSLRSYLQSIPGLLAN